MKNIFLILSCCFFLFWHPLEGTFSSLSLSHTEGKGIGYSTGYSSLNLFLAIPFTNQNLVSFVDVRGHVFNNGMHAANAGLGIRYVSDCCKQIWGLNLFYDYFKNTRQSYNQIGFGFEVLAEKWDFALNAYLPVGHTKKNIYRFQYAFYEELRNEEFFDLNFGLKAREQLALNGIDTLFGYHLGQICCVDAHISGGPYYFWGNTKKTKNAFRSKYESALGGRLIADIYNEWFGLTTTVTYDQIFKWCAQATLTLKIPFDLFRWPSCACRTSLYKMVNRNEIIAIDHVTRFTNNPSVLDPEFNP